MKPILLAPLVAIVLTGAGVGAYFAVAGAGSGEEAVVAKATPTPSPTEPTPTATPAPTPEPTPTPAPTQTPAPAPTPATDDLTTYVDPVLGFSLQYPPDLAFTDLTGPSPTGGLNQRAIEFRSPKDPSRAFVISVSDNTKGLTPEQWAIEFGGCRTQTIQQGMLGGMSAIACTREVIEGMPERAVLAEQAGKMFLLSAIGLTDSEFSQVIASFHF